MVVSGLLGDEGTTREIPPVEVGYQEGGQNTTAFYRHLLSRHLLSWMLLGLVNVFIS